MDRRGVEARLLDAVGAAMGRFAMLRPGDRVAVGVSGGKDSLALLHALVAYRSRAPFAYDLVAVTIEQGKFTTPVTTLRRHIEALEVPWVLREEPRTLALVAGGIAHGCDVCSRHRRGALYRAAGEAGCTVLALGHTADDCAEALLRNILFNGRIASLPPVARSRKGTLRLIRPLVLVTEDLTGAYARAAGFDVVGCVCGEKESVRREIRAFLGALRARHAGVAESIAAALGNVNPYTLLDPALRKDAPSTVIAGARLACAVRHLRREGTAMAQDPEEQQQTDAERIPDEGTGKLDHDERELVEGVAHPQGGAQRNADTDVETIEGELDKKTDREGGAH